MQIHWAQCGMQSDSRPVCYMVRCIHFKCRRQMWTEEYTTFSGVNCIRIALVRNGGYPPPSCPPNRGQLMLLGLCVTVSYHSWLSVRGRSLEPDDEQRARGWGKVCVLPPSVQWKPYCGRLQEQADREPLFAMLELLHDKRTSLFLCNGGNAFPWRSFGVES